MPEHAAVYSFQGSHAAGGRDTIEQRRATRRRDAATGFSPDPADALCGRQGRHEPALVGPRPAARGVAPPPALALPGAMAPKWSD
jgi:hypothetical protein